MAFSSTPTLNFLKRMRSIQSRETPRNVRNRYQQNNGFPQFSAVTGGLDISSYTSTVLLQCSRPSLRILAGLGVAKTKKKRAKIPQSQVLDTIGTRIPRCAHSVPLEPSIRFYVFSPQHRFVLLKDHRLKYWSFIDDWLGSLKRG